MWGERELCGISYSSYKDALQLDYSCILMTSFNLSYTLKAVSPNIVTSGVRVTTYPF